MPTKPELMKENKRLQSQVEMSTANFRSLQEEHTTAKRKSAQEASHYSVVSCERDDLLVAVKRLEEDLGESKDDAKRLRGEAASAQKDMRAANEHAVRLIRAIQKSRIAERELFAVCHEVRQTPDVVEGLAAEGRFKSWVLDR